MAMETRGAALRQIERLFADGVVAGLSDAQLLERFVRGRDGGAFEALLARHGAMVLSVCRGILRDPNDAEDAFQATFLVLIRKAGSIRGRIVLGGWLYQVAHRVAIQANIAAARRRAREREAGQMTTTTVSSGPAVADDLLRALHEEIARLPEKYRLPILLCDLEGLPQVQAAGQLRWSERTLRRRLAEARDRLKTRLERRGVAPDGAVLGAVFLREARAAVPATWHDVAVRAALDLVNHTTTAGAVSAAAGSLTRKVLKIMLLQTLSLASAALLGAALTVWVVSAAVVSGGDEPGNEAKAPAPSPVAGQTSPAPAPRPEAELDPLDETGTVAIRGRVLDPDGRPVVGAQLYVLHRARNEISKEMVDFRDRPGRATVSETDGRFRFDLDKAANDWPGEGAAWREARIAAVAAGFGAAWVDAGTIVEKGEATLRLVRDDVPIRGLVRDAQGRPVAGVAIKVFQINAPKEGCDLDAMLASGEYEGYRSDPGFPGPTWLGRHGSWTTDADGRFEINGVGRDRMAGLEIASPELEKVVLFAMAREAKTSPKPRSRPSIPPGMPRELVYPPAPRLVGSTFEALAGPTKPLFGVVRKKGKGTPIGAVSVFGFEPESGTQVSGTTDALGRFRLVGLPKAGSYMLGFEPRAGEPYLGARAEVTDTGGLAPIEVNIELPPGVPITGRLVDEATGKPIRAMSVTYNRLPGNPAEGAAGSARISVRDKTFLMTVPPGKGAFLASVPWLDDRFVRARLRKDDQGKGIGGVGDVEIDSIALSFYNAYKIVDIPANAGNFPVELALTRGLTRKGMLIGPDGRPVKGAGAYGLRATWGGAQTLDADTFEVSGLEPGHPRLVVFTHSGRKLAGAVVLPGEDLNTSTPLEVKLLPAGSITGRLVGDGGSPLAEAKLRVMTYDLDGNNLPFMEARALWPSKEPFTADALGRFRVEGLVPGVETDIQLDAPSRPDSRLDASNAFRKLKISPGEVRDLGDVKVKVLAR